jgi:hypothetical protein
MPNLPDFSLKFDGKLELGNGIKGNLPDWPRIGNLCLDSRYDGGVGKVPELHFFVRFFKKVRRFYGPVRKGAGRNQRGGR